MCKREISPGRIQRYLGRLSEPKATGSLKSTSGSRWRCTLRYAVTLRRRVLPVRVLGTGTVDYASFCLRRGRKYCRTSSKARQSAVISLNSTIQVCAAAMLDLRAEHFLDGPRIAIVAVCSDLLRCCVHDGLSAAKESLGCIHVPGRAEHRIHEIAFAVNGPVQIAPLTLTLYVRFIDVSAPAHFPFPFARMCSAVVCFSSGAGETGNGGRS